MEEKSNEEKLDACLLTEAERINKTKFAKNNKALNAKDKAKNFLGNIRKGAKLGEGGLGAVYELRNDKDYVVKVPHAKNYGELLRGNKEAKEELQKAEKLRGIIENYIKDYNFAGAQGLENAAAPVGIAQEQVGRNKINELVMPKAEGKDGDKFIFGDQEKGKPPIGIYGKKVGYKNFTITDKRIALSIALQKAMILRALNEAGYANIDTKLENIMISEHNDNNGDKICKVWMIDVGSIVKHGNKISDYTDGTRAPEVDFGRKAGPEADVFSDAVERPLLLFGKIALKFTIPTDPKKHIYPAEFFSDSKFKSAKRHKVRAKENEYKKFGFEKPKFPKYFTNAQKCAICIITLGF